MLAFLHPTANEAALRAENALLRLQLVVVLRILRELLGNRPVPLTNVDRADIARAAQVVGWRAAKASLLIVALGTVRGWFRNLVQRRPRPAKTTRRRVGRPRIAAWIERLVCAMARRCSAWGYGKLLGMVLANGGRTSKSTVRAILQRNGIPTSRERRRRNGQ